MTKNDVVKQCTTEETMYMVIQVGYQNKYVLPVHAGCEFLVSIAQSIQIKDNYSNGGSVSRIVTEGDAIEVRFLSNVALKKIELEALIDPEGGDDA